MARLSLSLLGPFQVLLDGRPVTGFESAKARALLAFLAAEARRPHARETLAELLWPEHPAGAGLANLRHTLTNLRKAIGDPTATPPFLLITQETLQFNLASDACVDLARYCACIQASAPLSLPACQEALALRRGPFLEGFTLDSSPQFEEWVVLLREQVDHQAGQALARLVGDCIQRDDFAQAALWTRQQLVLEPWNEEVHQQLIWLLAMNGQRAAALHHYDVCCRLLATELDVEPQPATQALAARIRTGTRDIGARAGHDGKPRLAPVAPTPAAKIVNLPPRPLTFFGRAAELTEVAARLADPTCRLLTVLGPGGMGKTLIAIEAAHRQVDAFADGVVFVDLTIVPAVDSLASTLLHALGGSHREDVEARRQLFTLLSQRQLLFVLDNFEHLVAGVDLLADLLAAAPDVKLLVTSRTRLNLREEWLAPLEGLESPPDTESVPNQSDLAGYSATQLFLHATRRVRPSFTPAPDEVTAIVHICRLLAGVPLGIELAAAWTHALGLNDIVHELERGPRLLATTLHDMPERHRSMVTVFDHSWRMLSADERAVLRQLSVFRGGCTRDAAVTVAGATLTNLSGLVDKSWLRLRPDSRYVLHELIRQYCGEKLESEHAAASHESAGAVRHRHCAYFAAYLHTILQTINYQQTAGYAVMAELGNVQVSLAWAAATEDLAASYAMVIGVIFVAELLGGYRFALQTLDAALAPAGPPDATSGADQQPSETATLIRCWTRLRQGVLYLLLGLLEHAAACFEQNLADLQQLCASEHQRYLLVVSRWEFTRLVYVRGDFDEARQMCREMLGVFQEPDFTCILYGKQIGPKFWQAHAYATLGQVAWALGENDEAQEMLRIALDLREEIGEQRYRAFNLGLLASILRTLGEYDRGAALAQEAVRLSLAYGDQIGVAAARLSLGRIEAARGDLILAQEHLSQSLAVGRQSGDHNILMGSLCTMGQVELALQHVAEAKRYYHEAIAVVIDLGVSHSSFRATAWLGLGRVALAERDFILARAFLHQALGAKGVPAWERREMNLALAQIGVAEREINAGGTSGGRHDLDTVEAEIVGVR